MLRILLERARQKHRTVRYPDAPPLLPDRFRGRPQLDVSRCPDGCHACADACPTDAIVFRAPTNSAATSAAAATDARASEPRPALDLGRCLFCNDCVEACPVGAISYTREHDLAARTRTDLLQSAAERAAFVPLEGRLRRLLGRSLKLRQVSAGGCNACEADVNVLGTVVFDLGRFGIEFVASPRHADGLLITGPVTTNMRVALLKTYESVPAPKLVIAVGACAISGGPYAGHPEQHDGADAVVPVDLYIPGCPPHPVTILDGILRLLDRLPHR